MNTLPRPRAVLLDLDDTILDDSSAVDSGWRQACEAYAGAAGVEAERLRTGIMEVREWYWGDAERSRTGRADLRAASTWIVAEALRRLGRDATAVAAAIGNAYRDIREESMTLLPGALDALERLRGLGVPLALITNGGASSQRAKIERFGLARYFAHICIEGEFGCGKPDARVYEEALKALAAEPSQAWMAGDNLEWDVAAPMRHGIWGIWVDPAERGLPSDAPVKPDLTVRSIAELVP